MPVALYDHCAAEYAPNRVFLAASDGQWTVDLNGEEIEWTRLPFMATGRIGAACGAVAAPDGQVQLMVAGGWDGMALSSVEIYDSSLGAWRPGPELPLPLYEMTYTPMQQGAESLVLLGGINDDHDKPYRDEIFGFDPDSQSWFQFSERLSDPKRSAAAVIVGQEYCQSG